MSAAPDDFAERPRGVQRSAVVLGGVLVAITLAGAAAYGYHQFRTDTEQRQAAIAVTGGDPARAPFLLRRYGCSGCHNVGGSTEPSGQAGPALTNLARQLYVGGVVTNTPHNLVAFIADPRSIDPKSAMPRTGITPAEARDVAAYLYSLRQ
ncbi:MAG TPA: c-type cytochrome [Devosia sp.]|nr:c-type cytochrome [Devosia sp.]